MSEATFSFDRAAQRYEEISTGVVSDFVNISGRLYAQRELKPDGTPHAWAIQNWPPARQEGVFFTTGEHGQYEVSGYAKVPDSQPVGHKIERTRLRQRIAQLEHDLAHAKRDLALEMLAQRPELQDRAHIDPVV